MLITSPYSFHNNAVSKEQQEAGRGSYGMVRYNTESAEEVAIVGLAPFSPQKV